MIKIRIPATSANLGAGFDSLGLAVNLYNYVYIEENETLEIAALDKTEIPVGKDNLIYSSAAHLFRLCGKEPLPLRIRQANLIPMARGLGSSSACIVAGLIGANVLLGYPFSEDELVNIAAKTEGHPDNVAPAFFGGIVTSVFDGQRVHWVKQQVEGKLSFFAIVPNFEMQTEIVRKMLPKQLTFEDAVFNLSRAALFSASLLQGKYENLKVASQDRLHQKKRLDMIRGGEDIFNYCYELGAYAVYISGAGPTIMAITEDKNHFFSLRMRELLDQMRLIDYDIFQLSVDNDGVQVYIG